MYNVLLGIYIILAVFLCILVMLQRSDGGALGGLGGGTGSSFMTGRSVGNALTKATAFITAAFFIIGLALGVLAKQNAKPDDFMKKLSSQQQTQKTIPVKAEEKVPVAEGTKELLDKAAQTKAEDNASAEDKVPAEAKE